MMKAFALPTLTLVSLLTGCAASTASSTPTPTPAPAPVLQHILFVGDSFTHGRYLPVRTYNNTPGTGGIGSTAASVQVVDENFGTTVAARQESTSEAGPWGGIPGIFAQFASEAGLPYDVHIEAISATSLKNNYAAAGSVIAQPLWNAVVLQEVTFLPIPAALSGNSNSNPASFCASVSNIEAAVHTAAPAAKVYLYETGAPADMAYTLANSRGAFSDASFQQAESDLSAAFHTAYSGAALTDGHIAGVAMTGDAWSAAWAAGVSNPDPYAGSATGPSLTFNYQPASNPSTTTSPTSAGFHHPSVYGAYLNALVLFQTVTGTDVRTLGAGETAAAALGITPATAVALQGVAWKTVAQPAAAASTTNPCS